MNKLSLLALSLALGLLVSVLVAKPQSLFYLSNLAATGVGLDFPVSPISIPEFKVKYNNQYNLSNYPHLGFPVVTWVGLTGPEGTTCYLTDKLPGGSTTTFKLTDRPHGSEVITTNSDKVRLIELQCSHYSSSQIVTKSLTLPPNIMTDGLMGSSPVSLSIDTLKIEPTNRELGVEGTLSWNVTCSLAGSAAKGCTCAFLALPYGATREVAKQGEGMTSGEAKISIPKIFSTQADKAKHGLVCVTIDGNKRQIKSVTDLVKSTTPEKPTSTPVGFPEILSFKVTPTSRIYDTSAKFSYSTKNVDDCRLSTQSVTDKNIAPQSSGVSEDRLTITPLLSQPKSKTINTYTLECFKTVSTSPLARNSVKKTVTLTTEPGPPQFKDGAGPLTNGPVNTNDPFSNYKLSDTRKVGEHQLMARLTKKVPVFSDGKLYPRLSLEDKSFLPKFIVDLLMPIVYAAESLGKVFTITSASSHYQTLEVPYWVPVKFDWRFAENVAINPTYQVSYGSPPKLKSACDFLAQAKADCVKLGRPLETCLINQVPGDPNVKVVSPTTNKYIYPGGEIWPPSCKTHPDGQFTWKPIPGEDWLELSVSGALHLGTRFSRQTEANNNRRTVKVVGKKCEVPFSQISGSLSGGVVTDITEEGFREWAKEDEFDQFYYPGSDCSLDVNKKDPEQCNSGDVEDITEYMDARAGVCNRGIPGTDMYNFFTHLKNCKRDPVTGNCAEMPSDNIIRGIGREASSVLSNAYFSGGQRNSPGSLAFVAFDADITFSEDDRVLEIKDSELVGAHAVVLLDINRSNPSSISGFDYDVELLDPGFGDTDPIVETINCKYYRNISRFVVNGLGFPINESDSFYFCSDFGDGDYLAIPLQYNNYNSLFSVFGSYCSTNKDSVFCKERGYVEKTGASNISGWLKSNYPNIPNFSGEISPGGVCAGWSDFMIRTAYLGNFIGECPRPDES